ncbi:hypothetical protein F0U44_13105 [Nocardioides humilatus]|uniref:Uncharacterized protein n=1 Tax=Nocardioides humilatus TaxID=2607660 RepID=A0A5B1LHU5_9ACTN|nr:hypothetical protein [Nocardioides humilatus]KAA1419370.1 hypothetical protein F0U44_13105 [Nocardioides humilatus]
MSDEKAARKETDWERRRRLAEVFGDGLPDVTSDERDPGEKSGRSESATDRWLKSQVPPHHGG